MQPAPTESSQTATSIKPYPNTGTSIQHGQPDLQQQASGDLPRPDARVSPIDRSENKDAASTSTGGSSRGRQPNTSRISSRHNSSQESSPGSRIDEYERAQATDRKPSDGMIFQVIPNSKSTNLSIEEFPNGMLLIPDCACLLTSSQRF